MRESERAVLAGRVLEFCGGDESEVLVASDDRGLTRFTHNAIHQNVASRDTIVRVRTIAGGRTGVATTNDLSDAALRATAGRALELAGFAPRDEAFPGLPEAHAAAAVPGCFFPATRDASADLRAGLAAAAFGETESAGQWAAGFATTSASELTIANTRGTIASFAGTACGLNVKAVAGDSTGFAEQHSNDVAELDGRRAGQVAAEKARISAAPAAVDPGVWTVILEPAAFGELIAYLTDHFSAQSYDEGSSFLSGGLGLQHAGENVTIYDDYAHPLRAGRPFDFEGVPKKRLALLENGVAKNVVTDTYWAAKLGLPATGHANPQPDAYGPSPQNVVVAGGSKSTEQLIAETERGLLVSRFWYIRPVDQKQTTVTGMTRDGTFLIERGKIAGGVRNMRFNDSILEVLRHAEFSAEQTRTASFDYGMVVPAAKLTSFRFTSGTDF